MSMALTSDRYSMIGQTICYLLDWLFLIPDRSDVNIVHLNLRSNKRNKHKPIWCFVLCCYNAKFDFLDRLLLKQCKSCQNPGLVSKCGKKKSVTEILANYYFLLIPVNCKCNVTGSDPGVVYSLNV